MSAPFSTTEIGDGEPAPLALPSHAHGEAHLISSLLGHGRETAERIAPLLSEHDFHFAKNRAIFSAAMQVFAEGGEIVPQTVAEVLSRRGGHYMGVAVEELERLAEQPPTIKGAIPTAKLLINYRVRRDLIFAAQRVAKTAADLTVGQDEVLSKSVATIQQAAVGNTSTTRTEKAPTIGNRVMKDIQERRDGKAEILGIPTGLRTWDLQTSGIVPRKMNVIVGATGMGKTAAMLTMLRGTTAIGSPALVFSLEMENDALWHRLLAMRTGIDSRRISIGLLSDEEWLTVQEAHSYWIRQPLEMNDWAGMTARDIEAATREFVSRMSGHPYQPIVYIDYAQIIANLDERNTNEALKIQKNVMSIREMAKNLNLGLVLMAQLNRNVDSREDKRPRLSDIADSAGIAKGADTLTTLYRPAYYAPPTPIDEIAGLTEEEQIQRARWVPAPADEAEWCVEKGRDGGRRVLRMTYHPTRTMFTSGGLEMRGF